MPSETSGVEIFMYNDGRTICRNIGEDRWVEVEAILVPEHGRLGDLDELYKIVDAMNKCSMSKVLEYILDVPTILEAST